MPNGGWFCLRYVSSVGVVLQRHGIYVINLWFRGIWLSFGYFYREHVLLASILVQSTPTVRQSNLRPLT